MVSVIVWLVSLSIVYSDLLRYSQANSCLQCRMRVCTRVEDLPFVVRVTRWIRPVQFGGLCFHGVDSSRLLDSVCVSLFVTSTREL